MSKNILLTSAGFEDDDGRPKYNIIKCFRKMLGKPFEDARVLFIPTAANFEEARKMLLVCRSELLHLGILPEHITDYELGAPLKEEDAMAYDVLYFAGGSTEYLLQRIKESGFELMIRKMLDAGKVYIGVSAGSIIATPNIAVPGDESTEGLGLIKAYIKVHCPEHRQLVSEEAIPTICLTDQQALAVTEDGYILLED